ncbi:hypothetical protein A5695_02940 [Mycobacterium sp. E1747]|nr:hypothetical protein A5695_02940 [Mycobacterium sp. E1747]
MKLIGGQCLIVIASIGGLSPSQIEVGRPCMVTLPIPYWVGYQVWQTFQSQSMYWFTTKGICFGLPGHQRCGSIVSA